MKDSSVGFRVMGGRGFQMTFDNGCTASVMFGPHNYCAARDLICPWGSASDLENHASKDAEIACWGPDGKFIRPLGASDDVRGWVTPDEVSKFLEVVRKHVPGERLKFSYDR